MPHHSAAGAGGKVRPKVLVVGVGNSALDIALELCDAGADVIMAYRSSTFIIPVANNDKTPADVSLLRRVIQETLPSSIRNFDFYRRMRGINNAFTAAGLPPVDQGTPGYQVRARVGCVFVVVVVVVVIFAWV